MSNRVHSTQRDALTLAPITIATDHAYIHKGKAFTLSGKSGSVAASASTTISFQTPANKYVHWRPAAWASTANLGEMRIAQGSTVADGSAATAYNRNHNSSNTSLVTIKTGVTLSEEGTVKVYDSTGSGGNPSTVRGGGSGEANEIVFLPSTVYTITFANVGATTATVFYYNLFWYEEDGGSVNG